MIKRCETTFEYVLRLYKYKIEFLANSEATSLETARSSGTWHLFADRSKNTENVSPVIDSGLAAARFIKITVLSANLPAAQNEIRTIIETDYVDRVSIVEFKVFQGAASAIFNHSPDRGLRQAFFPTAPAIVPLTIMNVLGQTIWHSSISVKPGKNRLDLKMKKYRVSPGIYWAGYSSSVRQVLNCD